MARPLFAFLLAAAPSVALAVPAQLTTQGRVLDSAGAPMEDTLDVTFRLMDSESGGTTLWEEMQTVAFASGFYTVMLGVDETGNPLEDSVLDQWPLYLEVQLEGEGPMFPRMAVGSVPYARQAGVAAELAPGADVDAGSLTVDGTEVVASDGTWTGPTPSVDWGELTGVPGDFSDGDDADTLADLVCTDGQWAVFDTDATAWTCDGFSDSTLSDADVVVAVGTDAVDLYAGSTMDGYTILTDDSEIDWSLLVSVPSGLDDGDDDTLAATACGDGELLVYNLPTSSWDCGADTDSTLTSAEVQAMVEAVSGIALAAGATVGGSDVLTAASTLDPATLDAGAGAAGDVLTLSGGVPTWTAPSAGGLSASSFYTNTASSNCYSGAVATCSSTSDAVISGGCDLGGNSWWGSSLPVNVGVSGSLQGWECMCGGGSSGTTTISATVICASP